MRINSYKVGAIVVHADHLRFDSIYLNDIGVPMSHQLFKSVASRLGLENIPERLNGNVFVAR